ncbi:hypothetical protein C1645_735233 [Glomus cerebriforme]|uniref:Uncharacterized protein n=1 Tax=Glomus cerebriforme TaxID=658196 RepID=A0A397T6R0_9GLOM|nr:hypothetical protein C1645_735233 [Glomus cerebriforme]
MLQTKKQNKVVSKRSKRRTNKILKVKSDKSSVEVPLQESIKRQENKCRLKAAWADIIKRYQNISVEETDVIDLMTEEIVVDKGILQKDTIRFDVGTLLNLHASKPLQDDADDDTIWLLDPNLCENDDDFKFASKRNNKTSDKTNDIIEVLLESSNGSFECLETESNEFFYDENLRDIDEPFEDVTNIEETSETCNKYCSDSERESLDEQLDSGISLSESPSSQSTENTTQSSSPRRLKVYSFNTFDSGHESESVETDSECSDSDNEAQQENLDFTRQEIIDFSQKDTLNCRQMAQETLNLNYCQMTQRETFNYCHLTQQETINYYQVTQHETLNYYQVESIDYSRQGLTQKVPPIALTREQQRLWLEPTSEDYAELSTWAGTHMGGQRLLN